MCLISNHKYIFSLLNNINFLYNILDQMAEMNTLGWVDYLVVALMLCINVGIAIYFRFSGKRQKTVEVIIIIIAKSPSFSLSLSSC